MWVDNDDDHDHGGGDRMCGGGWVKIYMISLHMNWRRS